MCIRDSRNSALKRMKRIREESDLFADRHEALRLDYAFTNTFHALERTITIIIKFFIHSRPLTDFHQSDVGNQQDVYKRQASLAA